jgi:hypothetical protein
VVNLQYLGGKPRARTGVLPQDFAAFSLFPFHPASSRRGERPKRRITRHRADSLPSGAAMRGDLDCSVPDGSRRPACRSCCQVILHHLLRWCQWFAQSHGWSGPCQTRAATWRCPSTLAESLESKCSPKIPLRARKDKIPVNATFWSAAVSRSGAGEACRCRVRRETGHGSCGRGRSRIE